MCWNILKNASIVGKVFWSQIVADCTRDEHSHHRICILNPTNYQNQLVLRKKIITHEQNILTLDDSRISVFAPASSSIFTIFASAALTAKKSTYIGMLHILGSAPLLRSTLIVASLFFCLVKSEENGDLSIVWSAEKVSVSNGGSRGKVGIQPELTFHLRFIFKPAPRKYTSFQDY